ncbi:Uma2 family endonuclease [Hymenobacter sp.]|uniref:Uma2 family endonuclease n=1 Tax=Hymenobacter sp. TaxID=1898978 RepID=UPI00286C7A63|nr:Uma2 family endonuclease [Hymenobacter sp.]
MAGPSRLHQDYSGNIFGEVRQHLKGQPCRVYHAPFDVRLTTGGANGDAQIQTVVQPDICVVCDPAKLDDRGCLGAPDWIVEILSPGTVGRDTKIKFDLYEESGVAEYWIVFSGEKMMAAFLLDGGQYRLAGEYYTPGPIPVGTLPGLALEWSEVFAGT